ASQPLPRHRDQPLALGGGRGHFGLEVALGLADVVLERLQRRRRVFDPGAVADAPAVAPLAVLGQVGLKLGPEGPALWRGLERWPDRGRRALLEDAPDRRDGQRPAAQPPERAAGLNGHVL